MKKHTVSVLLAAAVCLGAAACATPPAAECPPVLTPAATPIPPTPTPDLPKAVGNLHWFGVSSILYEGSKTIYFDPIYLSGRVPRADIVLLSHSHGDHVDLESLLKIVTPNTVLVISPDVQSVYEIIREQIQIQATVLDEGETTEVGGATIRAFPAYNTAHSRDAKGMGYLVSVDGERIYFAGGTSYYSEMAGIESDVTIYPLYDPDDVVKAAQSLPTRVIILVHCLPKDISTFQKKHGGSIGAVQILGLQLESYNP